MQPPPSRGRLAGFSPPRFRGQSLDALHLAKKDAQTLLTREEIRRQLRDETEFDEIQKLKEDARLLLSKCEQKRKTEEAKYAVNRKGLDNMAQDWKKAKNSITNPCRKR